MSTAVLLLTIAKVTYACGPGPDATILMNPTFKFSFYPPIQWTYYAPPPPAGIQPAQATSYPGQQASLNDADKAMKNDIDAAILKALSIVGVTVRGTTWQTSGYTPQNCLIRGNNGQQGWRAIGTCVPEIGAVTAIRTVVDSDTGTDNAKNGVLQVNTSLPVTRSQWEYLASVVYNQLSVYSAVYFTSPIELQ